MERTNVVTSFLCTHGNNVLLLRRSNDVGTYQGHWAGVSGYLETTDPLLQAEREIREETGLSRNGFELRKRGNPLAVDDEDNNQFWRVHPFRFLRLNSKDTVKLDCEHDRFEWCRPEVIDERRTVPGLAKAWERVRFD